MAWQSPSLPAMSYAAACVMSAAQQAHAEQQRNALFALGNPYLARSLLQQQQQQQQGQQRNETLTGVDVIDDEESQMHEDEASDNDDKHEDNTSLGEVSSRLTGEIAGSPLPAREADASSPSPRPQSSSPVCNIITVQPIADNDNEDISNLPSIPSPASSSGDHQKDSQEPSCSQPTHPLSLPPPLQPRPAAAPPQNAPKPVIKFSIDDILGRTTNSINSGSVLNSSRSKNDSVLRMAPPMPFGRLPVVQPSAQVDDEDEDIDVDADDNMRDLYMLGRENVGDEERVLAKDETEQYSWLQCTRYKPPKLPRTKKKEGVKKRKLGRNPRVPFTQHQVSVLEQKFRQTHYLSSVDVAELSAALNLTETRVKIWFQNRRARERRDKDSGASHGDGPHPGKQSPSALSPGEAPKPHHQGPPPPPHPLYYNPMWPLAASYPIDARTAHALGQGMLGATRPSAFTPVSFRRYV